MYAEVCLLDCLQRDARKCMSRSGGMVSMSGCGMSGFCLEFRAWKIASRG